MFALLAGAAFAHPNHEGPPISPRGASAGSATRVTLLVEYKQLAPSWRGSPVKEISSRHAGGAGLGRDGREPAEADNAKRTVYMFFVSAARLAAMQILGICGSLRKGSLNMAALRACNELLPRA